MYNYSNISTIYISDHRGSDDHMGFLPQDDGMGNGPLKTITRGLELIAEMRRVGAYQPITVKLMDEELALSETVKLPEQTSGITFEPFDMKKRALITGSRKLEGFYESEFQGHRCFAVYIPEVKNGEWFFVDLYVDGERAKLPRYPEEGHLVPREVENKSLEFYAGSKWFVPKAGDLEGIENVEDCLISFTHYWVDEHTPIESYDKETQKITMKYRSRMSVYYDETDDCPSVMEYYFENVAECFSKPNQWYLDKKEGILYYLPKNPEQTIHNIKVYAPVLSMLFDISGNNIRFRNIDFRYTDGGYYVEEYWKKQLEKGTHGADGETRACDAQAAEGAPGTIRFYSAHGCFVENCSIQNYGHHAIAIEEGCNNIHIRGNRIYDGGAGGIIVNGADSGGEICQRTYGNEISDNEISFCGRKYFAGCGITVKNSFENTISHNEIHDLYYTGISVGWVWGYAPSVTRDNLIEKNHIYNIGNGPLSDMGGIYTLGKQPGTIIRGNLIHNVISRHYGGWAIYPDEGSSYLTIENNICYATSENIFHQHYGSMNVVRNNIFAFSGEATLKIARAEMHRSCIFENNIVVGKNVPMYGNTNQGKFNYCFMGTKNLYFDYGSEKLRMVETKDGMTLTFDEFVQKYGVDLDSVAADPLFEDAENYNFKLSEKSPALSLGFVPFELRDVGVRKASGDSAAPFV